jgi:hypothetical protein
MIKQRLPQKGTLDKAQPRDLFQTPNYATELLLPFIPETDFIWECACGEGKIARILEKEGYKVDKSDLREFPDTEKCNFLFDNPLEKVFFKHTFCSKITIITNPPYSLKRQFFKKAIEYNLPFAFLISSDWSGFLIDLFKVGCQAIIPTRRIDFITPTGLSGATGHTSYFHSYWMTRYFDLKEQLTFVELTNEMKKNI